MVYYVYQYTKGGDQNLFRLDRYSEPPIYEQVVSEVKQGLLLGLYAPGDMLPSVRALSQELSVNPNTLQKAYAELERLGLCYSVPGTGRFISEDAIERLKSGNDESLSELSELASRLSLLGITLEQALDAVRRGYERSNVK